MSVTRHAVERAVDRIRAAGLDPADVLRRALAEARTCEVDTAVKVATLPEMVGEAWSSDSNGDDVWAIVRGRHVVTLMLRRSTQPATALALKVRAVRLAA